MCLNAFVLRQCLRSALSHERWPLAFAFMAESAYASPGRWRRLRLEAAAGAAPAAGEAAPGAELREPWGGGPEKAELSCPRATP